MATDFSRLLSSLILKGLYFPKNSSRDISITENLDIATKTLPRNVGTEISRFLSQCNGKFPYSFYHSIAGLYVTLWIPSLTVFFPSIHVLHFSLYNFSVFPLVRTHTYKYNANNKMAWSLRALNVITTDSIGFGIGLLTLMYRAPPLSGDSWSNVSGIPYWEMLGA